MKNQTAAAFVVGLLFALGLGLATMTQPGKVIGFLDVFGNWDPTLLFVMGGALAVHMTTYRAIRKRPTPLLDREWHVPTRVDLDKGLAIGALLFGLGWGLGGYCPGPAIVSLASLAIKPLVFVAAMIGGMLLFRAGQRKRIDPRD